MSAMLSMRSVVVKPCRQLRARSARAAAAPRAFAVSVAAKDAMWFPGSEAPKWLDGSLPGDYGFDPLALGKDPENLAWNVQAELLHARFAMVAFLGIIVPDALTSAGVLDVPPWYSAGATKFPFATTGSLVFTQLFLMGWVETKRWFDYKNPGSQAEEGSFLGLEPGLAGVEGPGYPGGIFDPLNLSENGDFEMMKRREIANGRVAMLALLGIYGATGATGLTPVQALGVHLADPWHTTAATNGVSVPALNPGAS